MKRTIATAAALVVALFVSTAFADYWTEKAQNPSWFPYKTGTGNDRWMDLPIPTPSQSDPSLPAIVGPSDPFRDIQGYWPLYYSVGTFANGKYYVGCGLGPQANWAGLPGDPGYHWPSNSYGKAYLYNRQSGFAIYDPAADSWSCAKWGETSSTPVGFNYVTWFPGETPEGGGSKMPEQSEGTYIGAAQSFAFDHDSDGTDEIFLHAGYPHWEGNCFIYDPDVNEWSISANAANWPSGGYKAQYCGGCARISNDIYCIGGGFWGPDGQCNMQVYHADSDTWTVYENLYPATMRDFGIAAAGRKIYLLGGSGSSDKIYMLDTENIAAGLTNVGTLVVGVRRPSVISWKGLFYIVAGDTANGYTNLFQVYNPLTGSVGVNDTPLPVNAYGASCAVSPTGIFYLGGAICITDTDGAHYNTSRLWTGPLPEQEILVNPAALDFWQTNDTLVYVVENVAGAIIDCSNTTDEGWIQLSAPFVSVESNVTVTATVSRVTLNGPTSGVVNVSWFGGSMDIPVTCDTPRPDPVIDPTELLTLGPATRRFTIRNAGTVVMEYTNSSADAFIENISPHIGSLVPEGIVTCSFDVTAAAPRPGTGTVEVAFNSYSGAPEYVTVVNNMGDYYVSTTGDDNNDGMTWGTAWRNISHGITNMPEGNAENGPITLHVAAGTYVGECTDTSGTNWLLDLSGRQYITVLGAGAEQSVLTRGSAQWVISYDNDAMPSTPVVKIFDADNVRFSGFTIDATDPPAYVDGEGDYPEHIAVVGVQGGQGIRVDHLYLNGTYTGDVYNATEGAWVYSWQGWWYHGICVNGVIGPEDVKLDHILTRGFVRGVYNNNWWYRSTQSNTNFVDIGYCTFIQCLCPSGEVQAVRVRVNDTDYGPSFMVHNSIVSDIPWSEYPDAWWADGLHADALESLESEYTLASQSNQFWSVGLPAPGGTDYKNENVDDEWLFDYCDYTNEEPAFTEIGGLPYSTEIETQYGYRDVGWNPIPEPGVWMAVAAILAACAKRRFPR